MIQSDLCVISSWLLPGNVCIFISQHIAHTLHCWDSPCWVAVVSFSHEEMEVNITSPEVSTLRGSNTWRLGSVGLEPHYHIYRPLRDYQGGTGERWKQGSSVKRDTTVTVISVATDEVLFWMTMRPAFVFLSITIEVAFCVESFALAWWMLKKKEERRIGYLRGWWPPKAAY